MQNEAQDVEYAIFIQAHYKPHLLFAFEVLSINWLTRGRRIEC